MKSKQLKIEASNVKGDAEEPLVVNRDPKYRTKFDSLEEMI